MPRAIPSQPVPTQSGRARQQALFAAHRSGIGARERDQFGPRGRGRLGEAQRLIKTFPRRGIRFVGTLRASISAEPATDATGATGVGLALPDKPSIVVLPFQNISGDFEQDYFADGMVEDIISGLSRIRWLFAIERNFSFVYKD